MRLPKSLAVRVGTVAATAAIAVTGATAAANASPAVQKVKTPTTLTATAGPGHVRAHRYPHTVAWIKGQLTTKTVPAGEVTGARILLERLGAKGHWHVVQTARSGRFGRVLFRVHGLSKGAVFELVFRGNLNFAPSKSNVIIIAPVTK